MTGSAGAGDWGCGGEHCITCSDEGVAMTVLRVDRARELAICEAADGSQRSVEAALVAPLAAGERVLVHAGVAIASLAAGEEAAAERVRGRRPPRAERLAR